ncbi:MAG: tripartite tricarboxylate transporter TctB family protein [Parvibaculaceae bacterium]
MTSLNIRDAAAGAIFLVIGALFALGTLDLDMGSGLKMGPGFFPLILAVTLMLLGLGVIGTAFLTASEPIGTVPWRGVALILLAPVVFGLTVRGLGLVPALALATLIASFASRRMNPIIAVLVTVGLVLFCVVVFHYGLGLPVRLFGRWLGY